MIFALIGYCIIREMFFWYNHQVLLNKLMSRTYYDFQLSEKVGKVEDKTPPKMAVDDGLEEDMAQFSI